MRYHLCTKGLYHRLCSYFSAASLRLLVNGCGTVARKDEIPRRLQRGQEGDTTSLN